jgi:hypothetical protein
VQPAPPCRTCVKPAAEGPKVNVCRRHPEGLGVDFGGRMVRFLACMGRKGEAYRGSFKVLRKFSGTVFGATHPDEIEGICRHSSQLEVGYLSADAKKRLAAQKIVFKGWLPLRRIDNKFKSLKTHTVGVFRL